MDIKPIVLIGNGPSIKNFDWDLLTGIPTFAMNWFYKVSEKTGFFPTYFHICRNFKICKDEPIQFIIKNNSKIKTIFSSGVDSNGKNIYTKELSKINNVQFIHRTEPCEIPPVEFEHEWCNSYEHDLKEAMFQLGNELGIDKANELIEKRGCEPNYYLNINGMKKHYFNNDSITDQDVITKNRWECPFTWAKSFDNFAVGSFGDSSTDSVRIAALLGYNYIILIGHETNFIINKDGTLDENNWGIENIFNGNKFDINSSVSCEQCKTTEGLLERKNLIWSQLLFSIAINKKKICIVNATENTKLEPVVKIELKEALETARKYI